LKPFKKLFLLISLLFFQCINNAVHAETLTGTLDSVIKGDTLTIIHQGKIVEIRLFGIDTPEPAQAFGQIARNFTGGKAAKGEIRVEPIAKDDAGRTVAMVFVNGINLNEQIISQGFGWVYRQHCKKRLCADWLQLESNAKASQKGLWADANPIPPWEYRQKQRSGGDVLPAALAVIPSADTKKVPGGSVVYHGNTAKHVFHGAACKEFNCPTCTVTFNSISEALDAGYKPHFDCLTK
jgi:endonuclease YncB( thermonuclease family)